MHQQMREWLDRIKISFHSGGVFLRKKMVPPEEIYDSTPGIVFSNLDI
jgi:hypothetical protein